MIKALFLDFYGTCVHENGPASLEVVERIFQTGNGASREEVISYWQKSLQERSAGAWGESYRGQYELALENFKETVKHFSSSEDPKALCEKMTEFWYSPEIFEDTKWFMEKVPLPVYFVTNSDDCFITEAIRKYDLRPAGIITSQKAKCSKPAKGIFLYALEQAGLAPEEVIHAGDSLAGDVESPSSVGIRAVWMNRKNKPVPQGVEAAANFQELLEILENTIK